MEKAKNTNQLKIGTTLSLIAVACVAMLLALGQAGESITHASPSTPNPGNCPIPPCERLIGPEGREFCECPAATPTPTSPLRLKGAADGWQNWQPPNPGTNLNALDFDVYYDWKSNYVPGRGDDLRYARMVWCKELYDVDKNGVTHTITDTAREDYVNNRRGRVWLIFNEPDHPAAECGVRTIPGTQVPISKVPEGAVWAARRFSLLYDIIKGQDPYAKVYGGGLVFLNTQRGHNWWQTFISTLSNLDGQNQLYKLEGVHVHSYPLVSTSTSEVGAPDYSCYYANDCPPRLAQITNQWYQDMHVGLGLSNRPIWITEMGWLGCWVQSSQNWIRDNTMIPMSRWFAGDPAWQSQYPNIPVNPGYKAMIWYSTYDDGEYSCSNLLTSRGPAGAPTTLGAFWNNYQP